MCALYLALKFEPSNSLLFHSYSLPFTVYHNDSRTIILQFKIVQITCTWVKQNVSPTAGFRPYLTFSTPTSIFPRSPTSFASLEPPLHLGLTVMPFVVVDQEFHKLAYWDHFSLSCTLLMSFYSLNYWALKYTSTPMCDDTKLCGFSNAFGTPGQSTAHPRHCMRTIDAIGNWMSANRLCLKMDKTQFLWLVTGSNWLSVIKSTLSTIVFLSDNYIRLQPGCSLVLSIQN